MKLASAFVPDRYVIRQSYGRAGEDVIGDNVTDGPDRPLDRCLVIIDVNAFAIEDRYRLLA